jgi:hypothetical protein
VRWCGWRTPAISDVGAIRPELSASGVRVTEACFASFSTAIEAFRRNLDVDEAEFLRHLEAASAALSAAAAELNHAADVAAAN